MILYGRRGAIAIIVFSAVLSAGLLSYHLRPYYEAIAVFFVSAKPDTVTFLSTSDAKEITRAPLLPVPNKSIQKIYLGILESRGFREMLSRKVGKAADSMEQDIHCRATRKFMIELYSRDRDPRKAVEIANASPGVFNDFLDSISADPVKQKETSIENEIKSIREKLQKAESDLEGFQVANKTTAFRENATLLAKEKFESQMEIEKSRVNLKVVDEKIAMIEKALAKEAGIFISSPLIYSNPMISKLQNQLSDLESRIEGMKIDMRESHPEVMKFRAEYKERKKELEGEIKRIIESEAKNPNSFHEQLRQQLINSLTESRTLQARIRGLEEAIRRFDKRILTLPDLESKATSLERSVSLYRKALDILNLQLEETMAQGGRKMENVTVVSPAVFPKEAVFPNAALNMGVAGLLGLIVSMLYCLFREYVEQVRAPERRWKEQGS